MPTTNHAPSRIQTFFTACHKRWATFGGMRSFCIKILLPILCFLLLAGGLLGVLVASVSLMMQATTSSYILTPEQAVSVANEIPFDCILVLGAGVKADGTPTPMLHDRTHVGSELFHLLGDTPMLMSGDHTGDYNEVAAMKQLAVEFGVDSHQIFLDHKGYSTHESMVRAKEIFGVKRVLIVTQEYHLYRAIHIARTLGMEAYGVSADLRPYRGQTRYDLREMLARYKDMFTALRKDTPTYPDDPRISLTGDGDLT